MFRVDTSLRYTFWKGSADLNLRWNDLFNIFFYIFDSELPYPQHGTNHWESRTLSASLTYTFNRGKTKMRKRRERAEENAQSSSPI